jgi:hypothetical protein
MSACLLDVRPMNLTDILSKNDRRTNEYISDRYEDVVVAYMQYGSLIEEGAMRRVLGIPSNCIERKRPSVQCNWRRPLGTYDGVESNPRNRS